MRLVVCCAGLLLLTRAIAAQTPANSTATRYAVSASAVAEALAQAGLPIAATRVHLPGAISARVEAPALKVTGAEQRRSGALQVRISCRNPAECLPFFAMIDAAEDRDALAAFAARSFAPAREAAAAGVAVGTRVNLELADTQMRIALPAIAIDTGVPGAEVRVASIDRKHTWRGVVVDATTVRGGVQ